MQKLFNNLINKETVLYIIFGGMTTVVNFGSYILCDCILGKQYYLVSNIFSFITATAFAFVTNKQFVFESKIWKWKIVIREVISFVSARILTFLVVEEMGLLIAVNFFGVDRFQIWVLDGTLIAKIVLAFLAVLLNYILSKCLIFKGYSKPLKSRFD